VIISGNFPKVSLASVYFSARKVLFKRARLFAAAMADAAVDLQPQATWRGSQTLMV